MRPTHALLVSASLALTTFLLVSVWSFGIDLLLWFPFPLPEFAAVASVACLWAFCLDPASLFLNPPIRAFQMDASNTSMQRSATYNEFIMLVRSTVDRYYAPIAKATATTFVAGLGILIALRGFFEPGWLSAIVTIECALLLCATLLKRS